MKKRIRLILCALLVAAWTSPAAAQVKFSRCLRQPEVVSEQLVRHGVFLREAGNRCDEYKAGTAKMWKDFDEKYGQRLKKQTDKRKKLFTNQFKDDAVKVETYFDGKLVTYHRHFPLTAAYCTNVDKLLKGVTRRGWAEFTQQAQTVQNEVLLEYKVCQ